MAQSVARILGKDEVTSSNLVSSSKTTKCSNPLFIRVWAFIFLLRFNTPKSKKRKGALH